MRVGSSPWRFSSNTPAVNGNSPGTPSCNCHRRISPQSLYLGSTTFGMRVPLNDLVVNGCLMLLPLTVYSKKSLLYFLTISDQPAMRFLHSGCRASSYFVFNCCSSGMELVSFSPSTPLIWY